MMTMKAFVKRVFRKGGNSDDDNEWFCKASFFKHILSRLLTFCDINCNCNPKTTEMIVIGASLCTCW